jgi:flagellar protein FliS
MYNAQTANAAKQYSAVHVQGRVSDATPHRLVQMLFDGALDKVVKARGYMVHGNVAAKGEHTSMAISIITGLRMSLDEERGGAIAANLRALYEYMERRLLEGNIRNDVSAFDEVVDLLRQLKSGWDGIEDHQRTGRIAP